MKGIAIILACCIFFLNPGNLRVNFQFSMEAAGIECCADSCTACCDVEDDQHDDKASCDSDRECAPTCDCSIQFQTTAITYNFMEFTGVMVQSYHYGHYMNSYTYEYSVNFLQPPRFG